MSKSQQKIDRESGRSVLAARHVASATKVGRVAFAAILLATVATAACSSKEDTDGMTASSVSPTQSATVPPTGDTAAQASTSPTAMATNPLAPPSSGPVTPSTTPVVASSSQTAPPVASSTTQNNTGGAPSTPPSTEPSTAPTDDGPSTDPTEAPSATDSPTAAPTEAPPVPTVEAHPSDHCKYGYDPDPTDETMKSDGYAEYDANGQIDTTVQPEVIDWMVKQKWQPAHFQWHNVRRCGGGGGGGFGMMPGSDDNGEISNVCMMAELPDENECQGAQDGYEFMAMHRHMITSLKALWPKHTEQFEGWDVYPQSADDVPEAWRASWTDWASDIAANFEEAQNIDKPENLAKHSSEGEFGQWLQCMTSRLHGELHFKWVRQQNQEHGLGNQYRNIDNYMFWKMHGWMDKVWEKYRVAKGLAPTEPKLVDEIENQCREMDALALLVDPTIEQEQPSGPLPEEAGVFHETVRPIFEGTLACAGCHGPQGPSGAVSLGGQISSAAIVENLVGRTAQGTNMPLVDPGNPEGSWLYLKISGGTADAVCTGTQECKQAMPPTAGMSVSEAEKKAIYDWIKDGAQAPTQK